MAMPVPQRARSGKGASRLSSLAHCFRHIVSDGGAAGTRTPNLRLAKAMLSQLSYSPVLVDWWAMVDSNHRPVAAGDRSTT